jgi:GxxExxY protein
VELGKRGLRVEQEVLYEMVYEGVVVGQYRADMVVEGRVIAETKATLTLDPAALPQIMNYLRLSKIPVGLVLHFGPRPAIKRLVSTRYGFEDITDRVRR